jgi:hypothetical protein
MTTTTIIPLSGSTNGRGILVVPTATAGTLIHTAHASAEDIPLLYAVNNHTADIIIHLEWGGTTDPGDTIPFKVPFDAGLWLVSPKGMLLTGGLVIRCFAAVASKVSIFGSVRRIVP